MKTTAPANFAELDDTDLIAAGQIVAALVLQVNAEFRRRQAYGEKLRRVDSPAYSEPQRRPPVR